MSKIEWKNVALSITVNDGWYGITLSIVPLSWSVEYVRDNEGIDINFGPLFMRIIYR